MKSELKKWSNLLPPTNYELSAFLTSEKSRLATYLSQVTSFWRTFWEAAVKSVKYHLVRAVGKIKFIYENFEIIIIQIEGL